MDAFVINLKHREDRRLHIEKEFSGKQEFSVHIVEPIADNFAASSLWKTVQLLVKNHQVTNQQFILICEDDHQFTENYSADKLLQSIWDAQRYGADLLLGGVSGIKSTYRLTGNLFWIEQFTGFQFTVIFRDFFEAILSYPFKDGEDTDIILSNLARKKTVLFPFISVQKEFGYSDVTFLNNTRGRVDELFSASADRISSLEIVAQHYASHQKFQTHDDFAGYVLPIHIFHHSANEEHAQGIKEFAKHPEFSIRHKVLNFEKKDRTSYHFTVLDIIKDAIKEDEDFIIIADEGHTFTEDYSTISFFNTLISAYQQGIGILLGGLDDFDSTLQIAENMFWVSNFTNSKFIIIFRTVYNTILQEPKSVDPVNHVLSEITSLKATFFPFISEHNKEAIGIDSGEKYAKLNLVDSAFKRLSMVKHSREFNNESSIPH